MTPDTPTVAERRTADSILARQPLVLFDGVCGLCNSAVSFIIRHDRAGKISFAPLQGQPAQLLLQEFGLRADDLRSILFFSDGKLYKTSEAVLRIARELPFPFPLAHLLIVIPAWVRDRVYRFIATHRYQWFGKKQSCRMPTPAERGRFL